MRHALGILLALAGLLLVAGCDSRLERTDGGGVLLSVSDFDALPNVVSVNESRALFGGGGLVVIPSITIQSIVRDIDGNTSDLMNVEMQSYEVIFTRADVGSRVPPPLVEKIFGVVTPGGTLVYDNLPMLRSDQLENPPLSDLFVENGGFDKETGRTSVLLNVSIRFFGRSIAGEAVDTAPARFTVEFVP
jgi:hypothetical protein